MIITDRHLLTSQQDRVLEAIRHLTAAYGYPPTIREIGAHLGIRSSQTIHSHVAALLRKGRLTHQPGRARSLRLTNGTPALPSTPHAPEAIRALLTGLTTRMSMHLLAIGYECTATTEPVPAGAERTLRYARPSAAGATERLRVTIKVEEG